MLFHRCAGFVIAMTLPIMPAALAASSIYMPVERVAAISPLVVEGTVARTASGLDPETGALATYTTIDVSYVHRGPAGLDRVVVREPGGHVGELFHAVDAVPVFEPGERVLVFLEPARDRSLRVAGMFFGKLQLVDAASGQGRIARRELSGQGMIRNRAADEFEEFPQAEIESVIASVPHAPRSLEAARGWLAVPPEFDRLAWDEVREQPGTPSAPGGGPSPATAPRLDVGATGSASAGAPAFAPLSSSYPARWNEADSSTAVSINIQPAGNPMSDATAAVNAMKRAMSAWTGVPEARLVLQSGNENYDYTGANAQSPSASLPPVNIILFNDPYNEITDPSGCSGTLAIGGYWRSGSGTKTVNGVTFYPTLKQYVIFNNNFQCFLGNADNLAEVATHEIGHGIGFGHSTVTDAIMRSSAYGNSRGPRLGNDDRDGAHCHYPHTIAVTSPNGGESWEVDSTHAVTWTVTSEAGADPGLVDIEYSGDGGAAWSVISAGEPNDGSYAWTVKVGAGTQGLIRVIRHNKVAPTPAPYPEACSKDASNATFSITASAPSAVAGTMPDGSFGAPLRVDKGSGGALTLTWGASCSATASDSAIYEGTLAALRSGSWDHAPKTCAAGTDLTETIVPGAADTYYLVAPLAGGMEGLLGSATSGGQRPPSASACAPREASSCP